MNFIKLASGKVY